MTRFQVTHSSIFNFDEPLSGLTLEACLTPVDNANQTLQYQKIVCQPTPVSKEEYSDKFGNKFYRIVFTKALQRVSVSAFSKVDVVAVGSRIQRARTCQKLDLNSLLNHEQLKHTKKLARLFADEIFIKECDLETKVTLLAAKIFREFDYVQGVTTIDTPVATILESQMGVCQDFSRAMIAILSFYNIDAQYVSGYLFDGIADATNIARQPASHAWVSVMLADDKWLDIDVTNNQFINDNYIEVARGHDYVDVIPVKGGMNEKRRQRISVSVTIEKL